MSSFAKFWPDRKRPAWDQRLTRSSADEDTSDALHAASDLLARILHENLLPFWIGRIPRAAGRTGIFLAEERDGGLRLNLILISRYLWFVSKLVESPLGGDAHLDLAKTTYRHLTAHLYDSANGGFFWEVDLDTSKPNKPDKHAYGQAFAIYALARYGKATGDSEAVRLAAETFALVDDHGHDPALGGYAEAFERDWRPAAGETYLRHDATLKLINTHIHLLEAFTALFEVAPSEALAARIAEQVDILCNRAVLPAGDVSFDRHRKNWAPVRGRRNRMISYGHNLEIIYLVVVACEAIGAPHSALRAHFERRFAYAMDRGFDFEKGGFFEDGPLRRDATGKAKIWWVQAEALLAALTMYQLTLQRRYLTVFESVLDWIAAAQVDWSDGEWHQCVDTLGRVSGPKVSRWKGPYHNGRAVLEAIRIIDQLLRHETQPMAPA